MKDYDVIIDWGCCDGEWVTREPHDKSKRGYVIANIHPELKDYVEQVLDDIDAAYNAKGTPLTTQEVDELIFKII